MQEHQAAGSHGHVTCCTWLVGGQLALGTSSGDMLLYHEGSLLAAVRVAEGCALQCLARRGLAFVAGTADGALHFYDTLDAGSKR